MAKLGRTGFTALIVLIALLLSEAFTIGFISISGRGNLELGALIAGLTCLVVGVPVATVLVGLMFNLDRARREVRALERLLPICTQCKRIRDEDGSWNQLESYLHEQGAAQFTHSICPRCTHALYPELFPIEDTGVTETATRNASK